MADMDLTVVVRQLRALRDERLSEFTRIDQALAAITNNHSPRAATTTTKTKRTLSPAGRRALRAAAKARWVQSRKLGKSTL